MSRPTQMTPGRPSQMPFNRWRIEARQFVLPKEGATLAECEDAVGVNSETHRYAVADGATEAFDAKSWAERLAVRWVESVEAPLSIEDFRAWVAAEGRLLHETWEGRALSWYAEEKARKGSFAAFVGLRLAPCEGDKLKWSAVALGDACLVRQRGGEVVGSFPVGDSRGFNSSPQLVPSREAWQESALSNARTDSGAVECGDVFLLLTDAGAAWYLKQREDSSPLREKFDRLLATSQDQSLVELLLEQRRAGALKDDDVAALRVSVSRA